MVITKYCLNGNRMGWSQRNWSVAFFLCKRDKPHTTLPTGERFPRGRHGQTRGEVFLAPPQCERERGKVKILYTPVYVVRANAGGSGVVWSGGTWCRRNKQVSSVFNCWFMYLFIVNSLFCFFLVLCYCRGIFSARLNTCPTLLLRAMTYRTYTAAEEDMPALIPPEKIVILYKQNSNLDEANKCHCNLVFHIAYLHVHALDRKISLTDGNVQLVAVDHKENCILTMLCLYTPAITPNSPPDEPFSFCFCRHYNKRVIN